MNFSNIYSYINIPTRDSINNVLTSITNNIMFCGRAIKQYSPTKTFISAIIATVATLSHSSIMLTIFYYTNTPTGFIFNNMEITALIELVIFYIFFLTCVLTFNDFDKIIIKQFKDYQREKKLTLAIKNLQLLPNNYDYNKAKECPITYDKLPEDATVCYGKTFYDAKFLYKWLLEGNDIDPMTAQKIIWSKLYKVSPVTVKSILNSDC